MGSTGVGRRWALPVGLVGAEVACLVSLREAMRSGLSNDTYWHWAAGRWMLAHHRILTTDVFSYTVAGHPWHTPEWGYDVVLAWSVRTFGSGMFWVLSAGLAALAVALTAYRARRLGAGWTWTGLLAVEAGVAIGLLLADRPQMVSYVLFAGLLLLLSAARRRPALLWGVPPLVALWANLHGSFLLADLVLALAVGRAVVAHRRKAGSTLPLRPACATLGGALLAAFVNPFGPGVYARAVDIGTDPAVRRLISEWHTPDFHDTTVLGVVLVPVVITVLALAKRSRPVPPWDELLLCGLLLVASLEAGRFLPYFAMAWCGMAAPLVPSGPDELRASLLTWPAAAAVAAAFLVGPVVSPGTPAAGEPVAAATWLTARSGRVFSSYTWNDYLIWRRIPVYVDGRTELYTSNGVLDRYLAIVDLRTDPDVALAAADVRYVLWSPGQALSTFLAHDDRWQRVWRGSGSVIYERRPPLPAPAP
jgi:hypothetical protein